MKPIIGDLVIFKNRTNWHWSSDKSNAGPWMVITLNKEKHNNGTVNLLRLFDHKILKNINFRSLEKYIQGET